LKLSILIPSLQNRKQLRERLLSILQPQLTPDVEVLLDIDAGELPIGTKRNNLRARAKGEYVCFVDDDDRVSDDYVACLLEGIAEGVDLVAVQGQFTTNGLDPSPFIDCPYQGHGLSRVKGHTTFYRGVQHLDAVRRSLAIAVPFPDKSFGEDYEWGTAIERMRIIKTWKQVDHPIYFYDFVARKGKDERLPLTCSLAIVMPCYNHVDVTRRSVESLLESTVGDGLCLIMVDDGSSDGTWLYAAELRERLGDNQFHYHRSPKNLGVNASWNIGIECARARHAEYIAIVNNDVLFAPGWDVPLVASLADESVGVVSPLSTEGAVPLDWPNGNDRHPNPAGYMGYMPILGAAFMCRLSLFDEIGLFPADKGLRIYFGDNWIVLAAQHAGYQCGYDDDSYVHHLFCITTSEITDETIWQREGPIFDRIAEPMGAMIPFAIRTESSEVMAWL
jgi:glycosyltransferase involved in cell wall biosynthesis